MSEKHLGLASNCSMLFMFCHNLGHHTHAHIQGSGTPCTRCTEGVLGGCLEGSMLSSCDMRVTMRHGWQQHHRPQVLKSMVMTKLGQKYLSISEFLLCSDTSLSLQRKQEQAQARVPEEETLFYYLTHSLPDSPEESGVHND